MLTALLGGVAPALADGGTDLAAGGGLVQLASQVGSAPNPMALGNVDDGMIRLPLTRGALVPFEQTVIATPDGCGHELRLDILWKRARNVVYVRLSGPPGSLEPKPDIERTTGVDFFPNPFFPEPEDYQDGRYQLWIIGAGPVLPFYYDDTSRELLGSAAEFPTAPLDSIAMPLPTFVMFSSPLFQPAANGAVDLRWTFPYNSVHRGDRPEFSEHVLAFPPPDLCHADPYRLDLSTVRPYISDPLPRSEARPWSDYLRGGLMVQVTVEPPAYFSEPPHASLVGTYSNVTALGGGIPRGATYDLEAALMNAAPPIRPWAGAGMCTNHFAGVHQGTVDSCPP